MATATMELENIKTLRDAEAAGLSCFKVMSDGAIKAYKDENGVRRFELVASSDGTDLVGDAMTEKALAKMESAAPGTTMFLNHQYSVPEDVFGVVETAEIVNKVEKDVDTGKDTKMALLVYKGAVEETSERACRVHDMMMAGRTKLGASISVLITDKSSAKDGRRLIDDVYYLECSIVGMPCNRQSWVQSASKAVNPELFNKQARKADGIVTRVLDPGLSAKPAPAPAAPAKATPSNSPMTLDEMTKRFPFLGAAAKRVIERTKAAGFFQEEFEETTGNIYFLTAVLCNACFDLFWQAHTGGLAKEDAVPVLRQGLMEFVEMTVASVGAELEAAAENAEGTDYLDEIGFYGLHTPERLLLAAASMINRAGARNSKADLEAIQGIHDATAGLGAKCSKQEEDPDDDLEDDEDEAEDKQVVAFADGERNVDGWIVRAAMVAQPDFATLAAGVTFETFMLSFAAGLADGTYVRKDDEVSDSLDRHADADQRAIRSIHKATHSVHKALADLEVQCAKAEGDDGMDHLSKIHKAVHTAHKKAEILGMGCKGFGADKPDADDDDDDTDKAALLSLADPEVIAALEADELEAAELTEKLLKVNLELDERIAELAEVKQQHTTEVETLKQEIAGWEAFGDDMTATLKAMGREPLPRQ